MASSRHEYSNDRGLPLFFRKGGGGAGVAVHVESAFLYFPGQWHFEESILCEGYGYSLSRLFHKTDNLVCWNPLSESYRVYSEMGGHGIAKSHKIALLMYTCDVYMQAESSQL